MEPNDGMAEGMPNVRRRFFNPSQLACTSCCRAAAAAGIAVGPLPKVPSRPSRYRGFHRSAWTTLVIWDSLLPPILVFVDDSLASL